MCSCRLADAGARVIKVERPEGDFARGYDELAIPRKDGRERPDAGESAYFVWLNRGKESLVLDLARADDKALLAAMLAKADVFVQNLKPGAVAKLGFALDALRRAHPRLVICSISGYGEDGPYAARKAYDMLVQAESGLASVTGGPEAPARVGVSVCDIAAGMYAYAAILEALVQRARTGEGAALKVSLFDFDGRPRLRAPAARQRPPQEAADRWGIGSHQRVRGRVRIPQPHAIDKHHQNPHRPHDTINGRRASDLEDL